MDITFSLAQILSVCAIITTVAGAYKIVSSPVKGLNAKFEKYDKMLANDKERIDKLDKALDGIQKDIAMNSDMLYQCLNHMATNNNSGGMKDALEKYNAYFRKG